MKQHSCLLSFGYSPSAKLLVATAGIVLASIIIVSLVTNKDDLSAGYWVAFGGIAVLWVSGMLDIFVRHLWLYSDRVVARNLLFQVEEIYYRDVVQLLQGADQIVIKSADGRSITVLGKMADYERAIHMIAAATGFRI